MFVFVAEDAEFLKCLLDPLILADQPPVDQVRYFTTKQASVARPVTKRDGCIEGAKDDQVLPNPLEDASPPDLEKVEKVATPFPKVNLTGEYKNDKPPEIQNAWSNKNPYLAVGTYSR